MRARMISDWRAQGQFLPVGSIVEADDAVIKGLCDLSVADADESAVAFAESEDALTVVLVELEPEPAHEEPKAEDGGAMSTKTAPIIRRSRRPQH